MPIWLGIARITTILLVRMFLTATRIFSPAHLIFLLRQKSIKLPDKDKVRILAVSVADTDPRTVPAQPLYDVLPSPARFTTAVAGKRAN